MLQREPSPVGKKADDLCERSQQHRAKSAALLAVSQLTRFMIARRKERLYKHETAPTVVKALRKAAGSH
jgi:hypothetical protein